ncbi:MAG: DUF1501 domain-containing protein [Planctomycetaceae bacterium]|nr:DUF1501 domain-containing protein [Planctomycetaceae bacterium]
MLKDSSQIFNHSLNRRRFLQAGGAGVAALGAGPSLFAAPKTITAPRAKSVVILYLYGAPSQMDTLDPKPEAPVEVRGEFKAIASSLPGVHVCEHLPNIGRNLHRVALIRSMTHTSDNHAVSVALSGLSKSTPALEGDGSSDLHQPYIGSVLEYLWKQQGISMLSTGIPINMVLPWAVNQKTGPGRWQHTAGWLGRSYNPIMPIFRGEGSREVGCPSIQGSTPILTRFDPWDGVTPESTFEFEGIHLREEITEARFEKRKALFNKLQRQQVETTTFDEYQDLAMAMIAHPRIGEALDITREPERVRQKYGMTLFGQSALAARRLVEAGVKMTTVFWDTWTDNNAAWDTHHNHHPRLKDGLCPKFDQILPAFLDDMEERGLLEDTLVMVISEHGRTPTLSNGPGGGREHWAGAYWGMFFGAGIQTGQVIGSTDNQGAYPSSRPTDPKDVLATMYHLLGIDPHETMIPDQLGRPRHILPHGDVIHELLS